MDKDQLGPFPDDWNVGAVKHEDDDLQEAIRRSIEDQIVEENAEKVRSMAVIMEMPESVRKEGESTGKGKELRQTREALPLPSIFAKWKRRRLKMQKQREVSQKDRGKKLTPKEGAEGDREKAAKRAKKRFMRPESQVPEGGWFKSTTSGSRKPRSPPKSSSSSDSSSNSSSSSSDSETSSSSDETSSEDSKSKKTYAERKKAKKNKKSLKRRSEAKQMKKAMAGVKITPPFIWDGKPVLETFDHWTYEADTWMELTALPDRLAMKLIVKLSGKASKFLMEHVATDQKQ
ncbi:Transcription factor [Mycena sanguinolenta]|uniref:Transcription factor n=1 Tax=Mycena sanguinolenta TaxID=230812 RepID=A0A8H6YIY7_9AGAR|nr:Transcription factor [Mycena sanguinolenta]